MSIWTALLIFAIVMIVIERNRTIRKLSGEHRDHHDEDRQPQVEARDDDTQRELQELRDRVKVLERITVDGREAKAIADEIEKLRDK
ncbi:hypothetical protein [Erythrobacter sp. HKB08]|uniref:hypothetical protein n=1 Tax=Erythrobacter sp. HKB08 TaxID=2502843 RepID=UPI001008C633|nr:hypothetical protein [Erythrobacter sp. HKB08]